MINPQASPKLADVVDSVRPSVVQIAVHLLPSPEHPRPTPPAELAGCFHDSESCIVGTGFFVNSSGDVITAFHVVDGYRGSDGFDHLGIKQIIEILERQRINSEVVIGVSMPHVDNGRLVFAAGTQYGSALVGPTDPAHDLALVKAGSWPFANMPHSYPSSLQATAKAASLSLTRPRDAEDIFACGYAFGELALTTTSGTIASAWNSRPLLRAAAAGFQDPVEVYNVDLRINPGNSGGPVFRLSDRAVIGVAVEGLGTLGIVVPARFVTAFLTSHGVSWTPASADAAPPLNPKKKPRKKD